MVGFFFLPFLPYSPNWLSHFCPPGSDHWCKGLLTPISTRFYKDRFQHPHFTGRKLRPGEAERCAWGHTASQQHDEHSSKLQHSPGCPLLQLPLHFQPPPIRNSFSSPINFKVNYSPTNFPPAVLQPARQSLVHSPCLNYSCHGKSTVNSLTMLLQLQTQYLGWRRSATLRSKADNMTSKWSGEDRF